MEEKEPVYSESEFKKIAFRVSYVSIYGNIALSVFKLVAGLIAHSNAMVGDAIHSASDVFSTFVVMLGIKLSAKESDSDHPYGHERLECVAAIVLAVVLLFTGISIGYKSMQSIISATDVVIPGLLALVAAFVSIVTKELMFRYTRHYARKINSGSLLADAWHHRSDALSSIGALIGIAGARMGYFWMDGAAGIVIFFFIAKAAYDIFMDAVNKMVDHSCDEKTEAEIRQVAEHVENVEGIDLLNTREFGNKIYVDMEIRVDGSITLAEAHDIAEAVHAKIEESFPLVKHIMVHVNPTEKKNDGR